MKPSNRPPPPATGPSNPACGRRAARIPAALFTAFFLAASAAHSAPLAETTAVQTQPDPSAPSITFLSAGTEPVPAPPGVVPLPDGWQAVTLPGPFEAYVENKNLNKALDVVPGSPVYLAPNPDSGVLAIVRKGDRVSITGLRGKWTQVRLDEPLVGYIHPGPLPAAGAAPAQPLPEGAGNYSGAPAPAVSPAVPPEPPTTAPGKPAADTAAVSGPEVVARTLEGRFVSTKRLIGPKRPYEWQLDDPAGDRRAYLDVGKLLLTEQIDKYMGHEVSVYGTVKPVPGTPDIVVEVESLQLR
ncbi:MAG: SH3 domain-containing protein [Opitutaceae bacterium]|jgi:hypothetical protein